MCLLLKPETINISSFKDQVRDYLEIERQITNLRTKLKKEEQFNRKMELNIKTKKLEQSKNKLLGGCMA